MIRTLATSPKKEREKKKNLVFFPLKFWLNYCYQNLKKKHLIILENPLNKRNYIISYLKISW